MMKNWQSVLYSEIISLHKSEADLESESAIHEREHATNVLKEYLLKVITKGSIDFDNLDYPLLDMVARLHISGLILRNPDYLGKRKNYDFVVETMNNYDRYIKGIEIDMWSLGHVQDRTFNTDHLEVFIGKMILETIPEYLRSDDLQIELPYLNPFTTGEGNELLQGLTIKSVYEQP